MSRKSGVKTTTGYIPSLPTAVLNADGTGQVGRYEKKGAIPSAGVLAWFTNILEVSSDFFMSGTSEELASSQLSDKELLSPFKQIEQLSDQDRNGVKIFLDAFLTKKKVQQLAG